MTVVRRASLLTILFLVVKTFFVKRCYSQKFDFSIEEKTMTDRLDRIEAILDSVAKSQAEFDREMKESREAWEKEMEEERQARKEANAAWDKQMQEEKQARKESNAAWEKEMKEERRLRKETNKKLEGYISVESKILEDFFFRALDEDKKIEGKTYDYTEKNRVISNGLLKIECDVMLHSKDAIFIVEVKHQIRLEDFDQVLEQREVLRQIDPEYANKTIHVGLAGEIIPHNVFKQAKKHGIYLLQVQADQLKITPPF